MMKSQDVVVLLKLASLEDDAKDIGHEPPSPGPAGGRGSLFRARS